MALPSSGTISLQDVEDEFGGSHPISISEYYGADSGVPSSGTISLSDFHGTSAGIDVSASNISASCGCISPCGCEACADTNVSASGGSGSFEYKYEYVSGDDIDNRSLPTGWFGSGGDAISFCRNRTAGNSYSGTFRVRVRDASDTSNEGSDTFTFDTTHNAL